MLTEGEEERRTFGRKEENSIEKTTRALSWLGTFFEIILEKEDKKFGGVCENMYLCAENQKEKDYGFRRQCFDFTRPDETEGMGGRKSDRGGKQLFHRNRDFG